MIKVPLARITESLHQEFTDVEFEHFIVMSAKTEAVSATPNNPEFRVVDDNAAVAVTHQQLPFDLTREAEQNLAASDEVNYLARRRITITHTSNNQELATHNMTRVAESRDDFDVRLLYENLVIF